MSGNHNKNPELILNHTWKIGYSEKSDGTIPDLFQNEYFQPGDLFKITSKPKFSNQDQLLLIILDKADSFVYVLDAELISLTRVPNSNLDINEEVVVKFNDTVGPVSKERVIVLKAVRFKNKYNSSFQECVARLGNVGSYIPVEKRDDFCSAASENILTWEIHEWDDWNGGAPSVESHNAEGSAQQAIFFGKPEPGQGTASGKVE